MACWVVVVIGSVVVVTAMLVVVVMSGGNVVSRGGSKVVRSGGTVVSSGGSKVVRSGGTVVSSGGNSVVGSGGSNVVGRICQTTPELFDETGDASATEPSNRPRTEIVLVNSPIRIRRDGLCMGGLRMFLYRRFSGRT